ncbi:hypothetical protein OS493_001063 [Desmophyllum pertusum]|uniref:Peptidase C1A papain C-terminal domain-containing protein n=1 Tax=Desmophyllum pertusum TaxID=174260 RepID=A0A9X0D5K9_9CNID|nr:hypothetical protein OS493_001063 [Desmophyllum pertusum]
MNEGFCHFKNTTTGAKLDFYMNIMKGDASELKQAIAFYGPVSILINTQPKSFKFYGSGIYYDPSMYSRIGPRGLSWSDMEWKRVNPIG